MFMTNSLKMTVYSWKDLSLLRLGSRGLLFLSIPLLPPKAVRHSQVLRNFWSRGCAERGWGRGQTGLPVVPLLGLLPGALHPAVRPGSSGEKRVVRAACGAETGVTRPGILLPWERLIWGGQRVSGAEDIFKSSRS